MKGLSASVAIGVLTMALVWPLSAQEAALTANDVLVRVDDAVNGAKDQTYAMKLVLLDRFGGEKTQELQMWQKGRDRRLARITAPAIQKGIAFLSLPDGVQYLYLPAFGKAQRITAQLKVASFTGTDFTYEDMEAGRESERWDPRILKQDPEAIVLELTPKPGAVSDYSKLVMTVRTDTFLPVRIEHYDKSGKLWKVLVREKLQRVGGYWVAMESTMEDLARQHKTRMIISEMKFDTGIPDSLFTEAAMSR
ncbi:MAG TPA: outer membrane lipoprotein-sorting protein [Spirochaetia bacterium]|nr:outer membrane lipoprotein-sorting protein [Spirochaetia bacterium]